MGFFVQIIKFDLRGMSTINTAIIGAGAPDMVYTRNGRFGGIAGQNYYSVQLVEKSIRGLRYQGGCRFKPSGNVIGTVDKVEKDDQLFHRETCMG